MSENGHREGWNWEGTNNLVNCYSEPLYISLELTLIFSLNSALRNKSFEYMKKMITSPDFLFINLNVPRVLYSLPCEKVRTPCSPGHCLQVASLFLNVLLQTCYLE